MASINDSIAKLLQITGASAAAVIDANTGMMLGQGGGGVNLDVAAAGNTRVVMAKMETMKHLGIKGKIGDILITLTDQFHIIRLIAKKPGLFIYLVLDKNTGDLAAARASATEIEGALSF